MYRFGSKPMDVSGGEGCEGRFASLGSCGQVLFQRIRLVVRAGRVAGLRGHDTRQLLTTLVGLAVSLLLALGAVVSWNLVPAGRWQGRGSQVGVEWHASD